MAVDLDDDRTICLSTVYESNCAAIAAESRSGERRGSAEVQADTASVAHITAATAGRAAPASPLALMRVTVLHASQAGQDRVGTGKISTRHAARDIRRSA